MLHSGPRGFGILTWPLQAHVQCREYAKRPYTETNKRLCSSRNFVEDPAVLPQGEIMAAHQEPLRGIRLGPFTGHLAVCSHTIPRAQVRSSAMPLLSVRLQPPHHPVLGARLTLAILPCSRHSCSSSLSFTVDANGLGGKRHCGSRAGKPSTPNTHTDPNSAYCAYP